ncbi:MAG: hypothetical protein ABIO70_12160 [Pseudomonadota bacterium]
MCWKVVVPVPDLSFAGRRGIGFHLDPADAGDEEEAPPDTVDAWADARERLALARSFQARLAAGEARSHTALAKLLGGISGSRVTQILGLLRLAPSIQERIAQDRAAPMALGDEALRQISRVPDHAVQVEAFDNAMALLRRKGRWARGLQHLFERARHYRSLLEAEPDLTLKDIGQREGISGARVGQILLLLALAPEIVATVDLPVERLPVGVTENTLRPIARMHDHGEQREAFAELLRSGSM